MLSQPGAFLPVAQTQSEGLDDERPSLSSSHLATKTMSFLVMTMRKWNSKMMRTAKIGNAGED